MEQSRSINVRICLSIVLIMLLVSLTACDPQIDDPPIADSNTFLEFGEIMEEARTFLADRGVTEDDIHSALLQYTVGYNRVTTLINSVIYADFEQTDRALVKRRVDAAIAELDAFNDVCKNLESIGKELETALDELETTYSADKLEAMIRSTRAEEGDTWYARRLIEIMIDPDVSVTFKLEDIARKTGVGMKKLRYIMNQTAEQYRTNIDIVDAEEYDKEIEYLETVRDTAGKVNATLALASPLGAFQAGAAATSTVTTTGANAVGWLAKGKKAMAVVENASAFITFSDGVVNLAVDENDIPPAFKSVAAVNTYVGIALGGVSGFKDISAGEKVVGIVGAATDGTTTYFKIRDGKVEKSEAPLSPDAPATVDLPASEVLDGVLPPGKYAIPDVDIDDWNFPEFDWSDTRWEDYYDDLLIGETLDAFLADLDTSFQDILDAWDPSVNDENLQKITVDTDGLPDFFEDADLGDEFPDAEDLEDDPDPVDFTVQIFAESSSTTVPFTVTLTAVPSEAFLYGQTEFEWNFGDGSDPLEILPGDDDYSSQVVHGYTTVPVDDSFTVSVMATDPRGFTVRHSKTITVGKTLQQLIDTASTTTVSVPAGTFTESIVVRKGLSVVGAGEGSTIIEGTVELEPNTVLKDLTVRGTPTSRGVRNSSYDALWEDQMGIDIDIDHVTIENTPNGYYALWFKDPSEDEELPFTGTITYTTVKNNEYGIFISYLDGKIGDCIVENNKDVNLRIKRTTATSYVGENSIRGSGNYGVSIDELNGSFNNNLVEKNGGGVHIFAMYEGSGVTDNTIQNNPDSEHPENSYSPRGGISVSEMFGGEITSNIIKGNSAQFHGGGLNISNMYPGAVVTQNEIMDNSSQSDGGGVFISNAGYTFDHTGGYSEGTGALFTYNKIIGNSGADGGGLYVHTINNAMIDHNNVNNNESVAEGGGIAMQMVHGLVSNNSINGNLAKTDGGGMYASNVTSTGYVIGNEITDNTVTVVHERSGRGGGLAIPNINGNVSNNTIADNLVDSDIDRGFGGGAHISVLPGGVFEDNTITGNTVDYRGGGVFGSIADGASFKNNTITGNTAANDGGGGYMSRNSTLGYLIKDTNSISGNVLTDPADTSYTDLYSNVSEDRKPIPDPE